MKASKNYENLNKHFESCLEPLGDGRFKAYRCSSNVPTVGWGSTRDMDTGKPVTDETIIDQATADRWFTLDTLEKSEGVAKLLPIILTQDEFDACVSFAYNCGLGNFETSTFRKRILAGENKQHVAKEEMPRWHHGSNGQDLEGLKRRRRAEVALFCGDYETVKKETYGKVVCVKQDEPVLGERKVGWFEARLMLKPGAWTVGVIAKVAGSDGNFATAEIPVQMDLIQKFTEAFGEHSVVLAAPEKPWPGEVKPEQPEKPSVGEVYLKLQRTGDKDEIGCEKLLLTFEGTPDFLYVRSGVPSRQIFRKANDPQCIPGSLEPIPQAPKDTDFYAIHDIEWAGGKDNYDKVWSAALGPVKVWLENKFQMRRSEFMFHVDGGAPGTAGCVATTSLADLKRLVALLRKHDPKKLVVAWGL
jgi:lysozyme